METKNLKLYKGTITAILYKGDFVPSTITYSILADNIENAYIHLMNKAFDRKTVESIIIKLVDSCERGTLII